MQIKSKTLANCVTTFSMSMVHAYLVLVVLTFLLAKANAREYTRSHSVDASRVSSYNVSTISNACDRNSDCGGIDWICVNKQCVTNSETGEPLNDLSGIIGTFLSAAIASGCGLGGGGLLVPLYILTQHLSPQKAIPLSKVCHFLNAAFELSVDFSFRLLYLVPLFPV